MAPLWPLPSYVGPDYIDPRPPRGGAIVGRREYGGLIPEVRELWVASTSAVKLEAARRVFRKAAVQGVSTNSGVAEQPVGATEGWSGARRRAAEARVVAPARAWVLGIESFIDRQVARPLLSSMPSEWWTNHDAHAPSERRYVSETGEVALDWVAATLLGPEPESRAEEGSSDGVLLPIGFLEASEATPGRTRTAGFFMADAWGCPHDDWHETLVGISRAHFVEQAIRRAAGAF